MAPGGERFSGVAALHMMSPAVVSPTRARVTLCFLDPAGSAVQGAICPFRTGPEAGRQDPMIQLRQVLPDGFTRGEKEFGCAEYEMKRLVTLPNILTGLRFALIPVLIVLFSVQQTRAIGLVTFFVFVFAALTDLVDGYLARKYKSETTLGKLMDPLADKVLVATALIMLIPMGRVPAWVCLLIICREIIITGFRGFAASTGVVLPAGMIGKIKSNFQYFAIGFLIFPLGVLPVPYLYETGQGLLYISLIMAIWSGVEYFYNLRAIFQEPVKP
jgi:CDP-diacylglycerol--glycerol-3-phosphate 3-phosphatidyltransferase